MQTPVPAFVLWCGPTGLTIARSLGRRGVPVVGIHDTEHEPCLCSRYLKPVLVPPLHLDEDAWLKALEHEVERFAPHRGVLFPASDETWLFIARNATRLRRRFDFAMPPGENLAQWPTKAFQYAAAARLGIPFPVTFAPVTREDFLQAVDSIDLPCLIKPVLSYQWVRHYHQKLFFINDRAALRALGLDAMRRGLPFVMQEYVPAPDSDVFGFYSYLDRDSRPLGYGVSRKVRQHEPRFGSSCISRSVREPRVETLGLKMLQGLGFHGISSVEFKLDPRDGEFKLMEINVRSPLMMAVVVDGGADLPWLAYRDLLGAEAPGECCVSRAGRRTGLLLADLHSIAHYRQHGELTATGAVRSWLATRDLHFAWDDLRPFRRYAKEIVDRWKRGKYRRTTVSSVASPTPLNDSYRHRLAPALELPVTESEAPELTACAAEARP